MTPLYFSGELLAPLLDIIYSSDEKDKVVPLLSSVMINVVPYLKNHSRSNLASFRSCSKLLASLSEYQNTRKAWKREAMELLVDPTFFQMDLTSRSIWNLFNKVQVAARIMPNFQHIPWLHLLFCQVVCLTYRF